MILTERKSLTVGLFKKNEDCELDDYETLNINGPGEWACIGINGIGEGLTDMVDLKVKQMM